jgi:hypothetical protein
MRVGESTRETPGKKPKEGLVIKDRFRYEHQDRNETEKLINRRFIMKISIRKMLVLLAIILSFTAVQAVWADELTITVTGTIERIGTASIDVYSNETLYTFYHIPFSDLATQGIVLNVGDSVTISAHVVTFLNGMVKNIAYSITVGDVTITWHPNVPKAGT